MYRKTAIGAFLALALVVGATGNVASAFNIGGSASGSGSAKAGTSARVDASANADARFEGKGHGGLKGAVQSFFSRHKGDDRKDRSDRDDSRFDRIDRKLDDRIGLTFGIGIVTDVDGDVITATSRKDADVTWTITTDSDTTFAFRGDDDLDVGDRIAVAGKVTDNDGDERAIDATYVLAVDADYAAAKGTVTAVDEDNDTVTVSTKHQGDVEVAIDSDTAITDEDGDTGVFADLVIGAKVKVQGVWNSLKDLVTATKVKVMADF